MTQQYHQVLARRVLKGQFLCASESVRCSVMMELANMPECPDCIRAIQELRKSSPVVIHLGCDGSRAIRQCDSVIYNWSNSSTAFSSYASRLRKLFPL